MAYLLTNGKAGLKPANDGSVFYWIMTEASQHIVYLYAVCIAIYDHVTVFEELYSRLDGVQYLIV